MRRFYCIEEIQTAFWKTFHKEGEKFFDYLSSPEECHQSTLQEWNEMAEALGLTEEQIAAVAVPRDLLPNKNQPQPQDPDWCVHSRPDIGLAGPCWPCIEKSRRASTNG